jgi:uncharacterized protein (UPF0332 family)
MSGEFEALAEAKESLAAAKDLLRLRYWGYAASRAYYAMFHVASALLLQKNLSFSKHSGVISAFGREFAKTGIVPAEYHQKFTMAYELRNASDYARSAKATEAQARETIEWANRFVILGEKLIGNVNPEFE